MKNLQISHVVVSILLLTFSFLGPNSLLSTLFLDTPFVSTVYLKQCSVKL